MFRSHSRPAHYALLAVAHLALTLPNLGGHTLWDMDEGVNAEAAREMLESGNWITPYYNYEIRTAKPALLYWLQAPSYWVFGVNEFAARLPAVLCGLGSVWVTYEFGRRMFAATTGLLAGLVLASCIEFCLISHAATPDPPLLLFLLLAFYSYWAGSEGDRRWWFVPCAAFCGLAVLTKGPVGVALPGLVIVLHLAWTKNLRKLWDRRLLLGGLTFIGVAAPWYGLVALDTKGKWIAAFLRNENIDRFRSPADGHHGLFLYHAVFLIILFAPWSVFLVPAIGHAVRRARPPIADAALESADSAAKYRFLLTWFLTYLVFFSVAATKLPNYILPLYPAVALLTARWLDRWRLGEVPVRPVTIIVATAGGVLIGVLLLFGLWFAGGALPVPVSDAKFHPMPNLAPLAWAGLIPLAAALAFGWLARTGRRDAALTAYGAGAVALLGLLAGRGTEAMDDYKVPRYAAEEVGLRQTDRDIRIGTIGWFRHSLVFYCRREVTPFYDPAAVEQFLGLPRPSYLLVPEKLWAAATNLSQKYPVIGRHYDFYSNQDIVIVANHAAVAE